ncbi:dystonin isoform X17 [Tachysurus ichikawai]
MGNVCGCVRGHKDECYVDPSKAPFSPASKELKGRRYFQRRKSRKSVEFQPEETVKNQSESEKNEKFCDFIDQGVYVGEVPVVLAGRRPGVHQSEIDRSQVTIEENLHKFTKGSRFIAPKNRLLEKKLLQRQLRRAASFGAVEHLLRSLRGHGSRKGSVDYQWKDARGLSRIICDIQVQRKRAYTSSGGSFSQCSLDTIQNKSPFHNEREISDIHVSGESEDMTAKERLLLWSQQMTEGYVGVRCDNFTTSWKDGRLFNAIIHKYRPDLVDMSKVSTQSSRTNLEQAFIVAEQLGVARLLDPEDVDITTPDEKSVITYVSTLYDVFPKVPEGVEGISANDVDVKWVEYQNMVNYLSQWIKHNVTVMSDRNFPCNPVELKALYLQYLHFKESEIPLKENEKTKIKHLYKMLEVWIEFGRIHLPEGYHPNDVEKEWGKLIVAMLEREKSLRPEVDRLEMLQQIADRVKRDCVAGEDKLVFARASLQSDIKRLESGIQLQNEPEIAGYLLECENLLRQQVVDIQILLDGKFYLADQLVQRVSKLRDHLLTLRTECSSVYSQGRSLSTEQTKMMISGITQSLNSGFSQNLNMGLSPALTPGSAFSTSFTPAMTPGLTPALTSALIPGLQPTLRVGGSMEPGILQHMKHMQIRKPMLKASLVDPSLSEEEVNMKFVQDLLNWVEEMQGQLDQGEWGSDLPSVESHLENHRNVHKAIEDFQMSIKEAQMSEMQMTHPLKLSYSDKLNILESQYGRLLNSAKERQKYLDSLHNFVSHATQELIWLNEREEEEVAFDWSERNSNISRKKDYHAELMRELDEKEGVIKSVQDQADILLQQNHPARLTIEAYKAAMQTQWSWILQLCYCVEQHLKENATYIEFFSDAKESMDYLKSLQDSITRKYGCDRTSSLHRLEDLIQESMDEKEQLLQYRSTVAGLVGRSKSIVQLKPRNPENPVRTSVPVKSICDYRQIEITIYKDDECVLANNSHRAKWKVISPSGNEAMVPSVCFTVPPPNKEAADMASRIEQLYQKVLALWHRSHVNMKSVVSWHYLMLDIRNIRKSTVASIKTMLPGEHQQVLSSLQSHFEEFLEDSEESEVFTMADCTQLEREVLASKESYEELLKSAEREEHEESVYNVFISEVRNFRMRVEAHEEQLIRQIRSPLERDDSKAIMQRIADQERKKAELDRLSEDLVVLKEKCEEFLRQAANSPSVPTLSSELNVLTQSMAQVYSMCSIYLEKLKTVNLVVKHSQGAEALVKLYEGKLCEEDAVNGDTRSIDAVMSTLKQWRSEIDERRDVFHDLEDELQKARAISDRMFKTHNERDFDLDWQKEKAEQLVERWRNVHSQIENRLRDLEGMSKSLKYYKDAYSNLDEWTKEMEVNQLKTQENQPEDSKALAELLNQQKVLVAEIEHKQSKIDECQKYSEQYSVGVKDYELQLMTYRAMVDSQHKSPVKRRRIQSSSDTIQQDFMDLRTRYTALVTLMTQYVKFASETLKRAEEDEKSVEEERKEHGDKVSKLLNWMSDVNKNGKAVRDDKGSTESCNKSQIPVEEVLSKKEQVTEAIRSTQLMLNKHSDKMSEKEKCEAKEQLKLLHQAHGELSQMSVNQTPAAEQEFEVIEGILDVGKGAVLSVCRAVQTGLIDHCTGLSLLEAQLITSELILPEFHMCLGLDDAFRHNLVDEPMYKQLQDLNEANKRVQIPRYASEPLPAVAAVKDGAISERLAVRIIEIQLATGGLRVTYPGENVGLERAFEFGLIPHSLYIKILQRKNTWKDLIDPNTAEKVSLIQLVQRSIVHEETGLRVLAVKSGKDGSIAFSSGREVSILRATHEGLIDRETMLRLPSAQLSAGGIVDPRTNCKLTVEEALFEGLIDQDTASGILSHQAQNGGIINPKTGVRLTVDEAVQCDLMSSRSALLVLEKQKCFMGLLWPHSGEILNVSRSIQHEIITEKLAHEVLCNRHKIAGFYIPENSEVVDIDSAAQNGFINACTVDFLKTIQIPDMFPDVDDLNDRFSSWLVMCELQIDASERSRERLEANEKSTNAPSSLEAKQLFVSFLMMNSYMDPKSGKRLLIFDRQLNKMAKVLLEMSEIDTHASALDKDFADDLHITGTGELAVLHIDEPLPRIVEGSISEMSIDCDPYVKTIESEGLTTGSGKVFNTSLERAIKAPEIKTSESASEDTNTDACPQYHPHEINPLVSDVEKDAPLIYRENSFQAKYKDTTQCSVGCSEKTEHSNLLTEYRQRESVYDEKLKRDHVLCLLRDQIKEGGILDVISLKRYNLNDAFVTGLIDDETVLEVLALQLGRQNITRNKTVTMSVLKQAVSEGYISSHIALQIKQQQNLLSDSSEKSISASGACEMGLISDNVGRFVLDSEDAQKAPTDPNGNCDNEAGDVKSDEMSALDLSENRPDTENAVNRSEEVKQLPKNPKQMNWSLDSSFSLNTICNEEIGAIYPRAEILLANSAQLTSGLDSTFLVKTRNEDKIKKHCVEITPVVLSAEEFAKNSSNTENAMKRPDEAIHLLAPSTELTKSSDSSLTLKTVSAEEVNEKCSSNKYGLMTTAESNALLSNLTQFTSSSESSLKTVIGEGISDERFDDKSLKTENEVKQKEKASNLLSTQATQLADSLETSFILKTASDKNIIDGDFSDKGLHTEDEMITLEDSYLIANSAQINSSLDTSFKADSDDKLFHELGKRCPNSEGAVKQPEDTPLPTNSKQSTCGLDSLLLLKAGSDVEITVLEKESFEISVVNFSEKCTSTDKAIKRTEEDTPLSANTKQVISSLDSMFSLNVDGEEITTVKFLEKSPSNENMPDEVNSLLTTSTHLTSTMDYVDELTAGEFGEESLIQLSDMRAASKTNESPESSENVQDQEQSVLSQSVDINERQTNKYKKDPTQCTISKTDVIGLEPEHECKSGTANDHAGFKAVVTQSSHSGVSVDNETVNDIVLVNTSESMDMFKECLHSKVYTSPTSKFLPDVTLSDDSNYEQHLAEQGEVADTAIELFLPNSGFVISETNRYDAGSLECKTTITPAHIMGEESSKSVTLKPNIPPNLPHKDFKYVEHYGDKLCVNTSMMESKFPPVYEKELEQTAAKGAVNEIQRMESHALDLNERISSTAATQHDSQIFVLNERSSPVLKQSQLQEMIQEMSEPEMLKEPLGWLGTTDQGDEGSLVEGVVQPKAAAGDSCEDEIFPSAWSSQQSSKANVATTEEEEEVKFRPKECSTQHYLECVGKLQDHYDTLEDIRNDFLTRSSLAVHIEGLQDQLETAQALVAQLAAFPASLTSDLKVAEQLLNSADELIPTQVQQDLAAVFVDLKATFTDVCHLSSERHNTILQAMDAAKVNLECTFQDLLSSLEKLSSCIQDNHEIVCKLDIITTDDLETVKYRIQQNKDLEKNLSGIRQNLEDTAFDVQNFISEHAQFLNPAQNRQMLKCLSATQRAFKELMERVFTQRHALDLHLEIREDEIQQQNAVEKQKEFVAKLQELCDDLTQTENRLIGHQQQSSSAKSVGDIQQHQQENQALQKDIQVNVNALNEVISSTKKFLEENRSKLTPEQVAAIERKLEEVKCKSNMLNQRAEETRKELEKVVTTVIKQETEKVAAVEQLEETKNKIEVLLDWVSNIGKETEMAKENGNMPVEGKITGVEDDPNGNALDATDNTSQWSGEDNKELDMDQQYERLKAHHQEILSQQQDLIIATQSAQALLDKQADVLSPSEKEQLQKSIHELRECYEVSLTQAEQQMKQMQSVQEELRKFEGDYEEFGVWLQQAQEQLAELAAPTGHLTVLQEKLEKQKCFYEDVISHKGDLRFITISGQKVLDVAKACSRKERKQGLLDVDTSGTCAAVKEKLDSTATRYKAMQTQCNQLGNNLKDVVDKYKKYEDAASCLLSWLNSSEADARRQQSEPIAADPQILQRQLEETKALQGQTTGHQVALETLRKTADALITAEGDLLNNKDELQEAVDDIVERYDNLSKSVSDRNEKLQVTLTRSLSVQDGLDEMMNWMKRVEENVGEGLKVPLDSAAIADALSKEAALEQDMSSRQSSISTMKAKVKKFVETAEPVAAAALQAKMEGLTQRFDNACEKHKQKISQMEQLKDKVEQFEKTFEKVQGFVLKHSHALYETDGPGKNVNELSQLVQDINAELAEHVKDMEILNLLAKELSNSGPEGSTALIQGKMANLSNTFNTFKDTVKEKEEEVLSCQDQLGEFKVAAGVLMKWLEETKEQVPLVQPNCSEQGLGNDVKKVNGLLEEWTAKAPAVQDINSKGSALCTLISVLTSPAKARMHHKPGSAVSNGSGPGASYLTNNELILVEQNMSSINEDYSSLGELLKTRSSELNGLLLKVQGVQNEAQSTLQWLENMKKTAVSWNSEPAGKDTMKMQIERQKAYEENMLQKQQQFQELRETLLHLIEESPDSPEAGKWKNMLKQIDAGWEEVKGSVENRKQHLEESSRMLELFQTNQPQLSQWLLEKDLMMSVLGPLSMDPNMLNMQKQQVQILLKEFEGRKPQYEQLNEAAMVISSASGNQDPTGEKVKKQLDAITQKWQDLTSQLSERDALIQQAVGKTTQFQDLLRQLGESAVDLELQLNGQQTLSTQPDAVKKQLEATNAVLAKLCEEKKRLKEAESLCSELSALVTEEYLRANLTAQLESISKPFKILEDKAGKRIQHLTSTFASSQEFHRTSKDFQGWIEQMFKEQAEPQSVSAKEETLLQSLREHIAIQNALSEQEEQYNNIMREAEALLQNTEGEEKLALQGQLSALRSNWEKVKRGAMERAEKLNVAIERAKKYKEHAESLGTWLQECEDRRNKAKFSVDPVEVENSLSQVKAIQRDVDKHRGQMELLNVAAGSLLEVATADVDDLQEEKLNIGNNMDKLIEGLQLKKETLEKLSQKLKEFSDTGKEISDQMEGARKQLEYHSGLGEQGYSNKNLTNMKSQQKNLEGVQNQIENLKILAQSLIVDVPEVEGVVDLLLQADTLEKEHSSISKAIEDKCNTLENKLQGIGQFQDSIREMFTTFADLDDELDSMGPVARDLKTLQDQEGTIQNFVTKLQDLINNTASARENCKKMLESEVSPDLLGLKRDLEALSKQSGKLMDRAIGRKEQVEETLSHLQEFYHKLDTFTTQMAGAEEQEESQGPVGMETDFINQQLEAFKLSAAADPWRLMLPFFCLASVYLGGSTLLPQLLGQNHYCSQ